MTTTADGSATSTASQILHHTSLFLSQVISQPDLRRRLLAVLRRKTPNSSLRSLNIASETLEKALAASNNFLKSSSLRLAERLLLSCPQSPLSSFLLSLIYTLNNQPIDASISLINIFSLDPTLTRSEIAPNLFDELFLIHLFPVLRWFNERRSSILSSPDTENDDNSGIGDVSVVLPSSKLLSKMSGIQATELKELERSYDGVIDDNCRVFADYFREILRSGDENGKIAPPPLILKKVENVDDRTVAGGGDDSGERQTADSDLKNGRYNPIWTDLEEQSTEFSSFGFSFSSKSKSPLLSFPQRVSLRTIRANSNDKNMVNSSEPVPEPEPEENERKSAFFQTRQKQKQPLVSDSNRDNSSGPRKIPNTPPKDFVCPITSHLFDDPVTLETGQTYERKAIQEWLDRGNTTCPITRQNLQSTQIPKTNYVLKRLVASWQEQNPQNQTEVSKQKAQPGFTSPVSRQDQNPLNQTEVSEQKAQPGFRSPDSVITQAGVDTTMNELRQAITNLCMSEILSESEMAVIFIKNFWQETYMDLEVQNMLAKPPVINGFVEILFNSVDAEVLKATVYLLSELGSRDKAVIQTLTRVESDVDCILALFKKGLIEAVVLIYQLRTSTMRLLEMDMVESLLKAITNQEETVVMCMKPKTASVLLLWQIIGGSEESIVASIANAIVSTKVVESIVGSLEAETTEERITSVGILLVCMQEHGKCRNLISDKAPLAPVLEIFATANDDDRFTIVKFFGELVRLSRRKSNTQILCVIKDESPFSTMHMLLNYLQTALQDQCPAVAGLLLQLDLLAEPRKMSIYREEAIDALISCLRQPEFPAAQVASANTILSLQGKFTPSGKSLTRAFLLKRAGHSKTYRNLIRMEQLGNLSGEMEETKEEERAAEEWERRVAFALVSHEFGLIFEALAEGMKSRYPELSSACFVAATWLVHMLDVLPDTGLRGAARVCLLKRFVSVFKSAKHTEDRVLSLLALKSFTMDSEGLRDLVSYMKDIKKGLRELKKSCSLAVEIMKILSEGHDSSAELWSHVELAQVDCSENGEVSSIVCFKDKIFSGHSDGTIKVWTGRGSVLHLMQEIREHNKAVTSLVVLQSEEKLYSGSLDKTARVWSISNDALHCVEIHDMKDQVHNLVAVNRISCFIPQGAGVKVQSWNGGSKLLNPNKHVKCLSLVQGKLYTGCQDSSIQEIDLATATIMTIQHGTRKLLGKANPIHAIQVHDGLIYSASSGLDGAAVKIWSGSSYELVGSVPTTMEVRAMALSSELIYLGSKGGIVEIWDIKKLSKLETLQTCSEGGRILSMALDTNEEILVIGTSDGRIQAWGLS